MRPPSVHYLRGNAAERSPRRCVFLDTETTWADDGDREHHTLRLWVARLLVRAGDPRVTVSESWAQGHTADQLIGALEAWNRTAAATWVFCHNLAFDLCTTRLPSRLLAAGWSLGDHALHADAPWARFSRGRRRITLVDLATWLPRPVERLGLDLGMVKPELPDQAAGDEVWFDRCRSDVLIESTAAEQLLDWWDRGHLGCWSLTGTATGWNAARHRFRHDRVLIDPDPEARSFERQAIYAGRRDCWQVGTLPRRRYVLLDLERAHLTVARCHPLPVRRGRWRGPEGFSDRHFGGGIWEGLCDVTVRTATPRYPWRHDRRVWHPVGTFRTILCAPEIAEARRRGELVAIHGGRRYLLGGAMGEWAHWLGGILDGEAEDAPPMARVFAKMCSHRVFGKWAARTSRPEEPWFEGGRGWRLERGHILPDGHRLTTMYLDGMAYPQVHDQEADDSFPAVLAWIQSHVRVAIGRLADCFDRSRLVSCNTDGLLVAAEVDPDLERLSAICAPFRVRIKATYHDVEVIGAAHQILDGRRRLSGVPSSASPTGERTLAWETWPRMRRQLELGAEDGYVREHRSVDLASVPVPRWVLGDGTTRPIMTGVDSLGTTTIFPFVPGYTQTLTPALAPTQHSTLAALLAERESRPSSSAGR